MSIWSATGQNKAILSWVRVIKIHITVNPLHVQMSVLQYPTQKLTTQSTYKIFITDFSFGLVRGKANISVRYRAFTAPLEIEDNANSAFLLFSKNLQCSYQCLHRLCNSAAGAMSICPSVIPSTFSNLKPFVTHWGIPRKQAGIFLKITKQC